MAKRPPNIKERGQGLDFPNIGREDLDGDHIPLGNALAQIADLLQAVGEDGRDDSSKMDHICEANPIDLSAELPFLNCQADAEDRPSEHEDDDLLAPHAASASDH